MHSIRTLVPILLLSLLLPSCAIHEPVSVTNSWAYSELRSLDPSDTFQPSQDILAVYVRDVDISKISNPVTITEKFLGTKPSHTQIRLDLLDLAIRSTQDIYLALDHKQGGSKPMPLNTPADIEWDTLIIIPALGPIQAITPDGSSRLGLGVQVLRHPELDTITISFNQMGLTQLAGFYSQLFTTSAGSPIVADKTSPFHTSDSPPAPAPVLFAFWNTFPAYTPAQTLRRWDGAHTGPLGGRHGLYNLLRAARNHNIPMALLDLKTPTSISALEYGNGLDFIQDLVDMNLLILPDRLPPYSLPGSYQAELAAKSRITALAFGLPTSQFIYAPLSEGLPAGYPIVFTSHTTSQTVEKPELAPIYISRWKDRLVIPIPIELPADQATLDGPSLEVRRSLIKIALTGGESNGSKSPPILVLGGDLPKSTWGEPLRARATFKYIKAHPWINPLDANDLFASQSVSGEQWRTSSLSLSPSSDSIIKELLIAPPGHLTEAAFDAYLALFAPLTITNPELTALREAYLGQVSMLLAAAEWEANPYTRADCSRDLDMDGEAECILASTEIFSIIETYDGSLVFVFARTPSGTHQIIGPSSQFIVGLSDSTRWDPNSGLNADPSVIPGAFADDFGPYQVAPGEDYLSFQSTAATKTYSLIPAGLRFEYQISTPTSWQIPLVLDPWIRFEPAWDYKYRGGFTENDWLWSLNPGFSVKIASSTDLSSHQFTETKKSMGEQENPNFEFPPGHFLPFPLSLVEIQPLEDGYAEIRILP